MRGSSRAKAARARPWGRRREALRHRLEGQIGLMTFDPAGPRVAVKPRAGNDHIAVGSRRQQRARARA